MIRTEEPRDYYEVECLNRLAFWKESRLEKNGIGCDEHFLVHQLRQSEDYVKELDLVYEEEGAIIGHILYTKAKVVSENGAEHPVLCFGPLAVHPKHQKKGIGVKLMKASFEKALTLGYDAVLIFGHPTYYPRVGFKEAKDFNISTSDGENFPAFMAIELKEGALKNVSGRYFYSKDFDMDPEAVKAYEQAHLAKSPSTK